MRKEETSMGELLELFGERSDSKGWLDIAIKQIGDSQFEVYFYIDGKRSGNPVIVTSRRQAYEVCRVIAA